MKNRTTRTFTLDVRTIEALKTLSSETGWSVDDALDLLVRDQIVRNEPEHAERIYGKVRK